MISRFLEAGLAASVNDALQQPFDLCMDILEGRSYAEAYSLVKNTADESKLPDTPMVKRALDYLWAAKAKLFEDKMAARRAKLKPQR